MTKKLEVYKKYFETASDSTHLVMHRGYALALVKTVEELNKHNEVLIIENLKLKSK